MTLQIPRPADDYDASQMRRSFDILEQRLRLLESAAANGYVIANPPASLRSIDGVAGTNAQVLQMFVTLIKDLKNKGVIGK